MSTKNHAYSELIGNFDKMECIEMEDHSRSDLEMDEDRHLIESFKYNQDITFRRGHRNCATCIDAKLTNSGPKCATGGKDCTVLLWDLHNLKIVSSLKGTRNDYLKSDLPSSNIASALLAENVVFSGCTDGKIVIWDVRQGKSHSFIAHKGYVTGICHCETPTHELIDNIDLYGDVKKLDYDNYIYSCGSDGTILQWDLRNTCVHLNESKGHVGCINDMISLGQDKLLTTGSDRTTRLWNINSNSHHIYNGGGECCVPIGRKNFASGDDQGNIYVFQKGKKAPIKRLCIGNWVTAIAFYNNKLLFGARIGDQNNISYCTVDEQDASMEISEVVKDNVIDGVVNGIKTLGNVAFSVVGTNHKFGRWFRESGKNGILVTTL